MAIGDNPQIAKAIKKLREPDPQTTFAVKVGKSYNSLQRYEARGNAPAPVLDRLEQIARERGEAGLAQTFAAAAARLRAAESTKSLPSIDGGSKPHHNISTAPIGGDGQIEFEVEGVKYAFTPVDLAWLVRLHRVLRCKNQNLANAIRSNLVAFEESVSARERVSELEERLSKLELERGRTTDVSELRDDKPGAAEKLSLPKGHAPSGGKKPSAGGGKRHTD